MQGNDLDNGVPPRVLVHIAAVFDRTPGFKKVWGVFPSSTTSYVIDMRSLSYFTRWSTKGLIMELFHYSEDNWDGEKCWEIVEAFHAPFNTILEFRDPDHLSDYLNFSPDVLSVADPLHPMRFGSRSLDDI